MMLLSNLWLRLEMGKQHYSGDFKRKDYSENIKVHGRIIYKFILWEDNDGIQT
jgi:hypothetical protein